MLHHIKDCIKHCSDISKIWQPQRNEYSRSADECFPHVHSATLNAHNFPHINIGLAFGIYLPTLNI